MGLLVEGEWHDRWYDTKSTEGRFVRQDAQFRNWITPDGEKGPSGEPGFKALAGRYHLYVSYACPWAHRTLIFRKLKELEGAFSVDVVHPDMGAEGWTFDDNFPEATGDRVNGMRRLYEIYTKASPNYTGRVTVPVLWDKDRETIVSNESSEIIRMFNSAFNVSGRPSHDYYPEALRDDIDTVNARIYETVNNGVYRCGFATTQEAYEEAFRALFNTLDWLEERLSATRYLMGRNITEADWRLFTTLVRFDPVYVGHFKCNLKRILDYQNLSHYVRDLYQMPGIAETVNMEHIKRHYYGSHATVNPTRIIPLGPEVDYGAPHDRTRFGE